MLVTCPGCQKRLRVSENRAGKKVRCPGCAGVLTVPAAGPTAKPPAAPAEPVSTDPQIRCAQCKKATVEKLPPNRISRYPGYVCTSCNTVMRPPGKIATYLMVIVLAGLLAAGGIAAVAIEAFSDSPVDLRTEGGLMIMILGLTLVSWAVVQLRYPVPIDAPTPPSRIGFWLLVLFLSLLVVGAAVFGFFYYLQEML